MKGLQEKQLSLKATSDVFEDTGVFFPMEQSKPRAQLGEGGKQREGRRWIKEGKTRTVQWLEYRRGLITE